MRVARPIILTDVDKQILQKNVRSKVISVRLSERSKIVLLAAQGLTNKTIAQKLNILPNKVGKWRNRFSEEGLDI